MTDAWYTPESLDRQLVALARDERVMGAAACNADFTTRSSTPGFPEEFSCLAVGQRVRATAQAASDARRHDLYGLIPSAPF